MTTSIREALTKELLNRGFARRDGGLAAPHDTMVLDEEFLASTSLADFIDLMVARREKIIFGSVPVVGADNAKRNYAGAVAIVDAAKAVIAQLEASASP